MKIVSTLIFSLVMGAANLSAGSNSIFDAQEFTFSQKVGKFKYDINIKANGDGTYKFIVKKNGKEHLNKANIEVGKGGEDDGSAMFQFDLANEHIDLKRVSIFQDAKGKYSYMIWYENSVGGKAIKVK